MWGGYLWDERNQLFNFIQKLNQSRKTQQRRGGPLDLFPLRSISE
jgi:hypothetical protein